MKADRVSSTKFELLLFFILVFIVSWGAIFILAGPDGFPIAEDQAVKMGMAILLGPVFACTLLTAMSGRSGFRGLFSHLLKWRVNVRWYAAALLIAPLSTVVILGLLSLFSSDYKPNISLSSDRISLVITGISAGLFVGIFEELGWTGIAAPKILSKKNIFKTGIVLGIIWGAWHFPLFWQEDSFKEWLPFLLLITRLFTWLLPYRVLMVWIYKKTESLFVTILMHTSLVATLIIFDPVVEGVSLVIYIAARAIILWLISALLVLGREEKAMTSHG